MVHMCNLNCKVFCKYLVAEQVLYIDLSLKFEKKKFHVDYIVILILLSFIHLEMSYVFLSWINLLTLCIKFLPLFAAYTFQLSNSE